MTKRTDEEIRKEMSRISLELMHLSNEAGAGPQQDALIKADCALFDYLLTVNRKQNDQT